MAIRAKFSGTCEFCNRRYLVDAEIERFLDRWAHAACARPRPPMPARFRGRCGLCGVAYPVGTSIEYRGTAWFHHECVERDRASFAQRLEQTPRYEERLQMELGYVRLWCPDATALETMVIEERKSWSRSFLSTQAYVIRPSGKVLAGEFRRQLPEAYFPACQDLAELATDGFNGESFPDWATYPAPA
jgi:hypothetical protein